MGRKKEELEIKGLAVELYQLPITLSCKVLVRLTKILGKSVGSMADQSQNDANKKSLLDKNINLENLFSGISEKLEEDIVIDTIKLLLPYIYIEKKQVKTLEFFDEYGIDFLLKVVFESLKLNYSDFLVETLG